MNAVTQDVVIGWKRLLLGSEVQLLAMTKHILNAPIVRAVVKKRQRKVEV